MGALGLCRWPRGALQPRADRAAGPPGLDQEQGLAKGCTRALLREESLLGESVCPTLSMLSSHGEPRYTFRGGMHTLTLPQRSAPPSSILLSGTMLPEPSVSLKGDGSCATWPA